MIFNRRVFTRKRLVALGLLFCCFISLKIILKHIYHDPGYVKPLSPSENIVSCYYDTENILPSAERSYAAKSIFFIESSCRGGLRPRQACSVEAAARAHPYWDVQVLFVAPVKAFVDSIKTLQQFDNIHFARINISEYAKGTPVEYLFASGVLNTSLWRVAHTSDILRFTTLYKWGGVYLDFDSVVVKPFDSLKRNWAARESELHVAIAALSFSRDSIGRIVADKIVRDLADNYRGDIWSHNGPGVITRILKEICATSYVNKMTAEKCNGFAVYNKELFYPIPWETVEYYFEPGVLDFPAAYVHHLWNQKTHRTQIPSNSRYANLAKRYCPTIYKTHSKHFGGKTNIGMSGTYY